MNILPISNNNRQNFSNQNQPNFKMLYVEKNPQMKEKLLNLKRTKPETFEIITGWFETLKDTKFVNGFLGLNGLLDLTLILTHPKNFVWPGELNKGMCIPTPTGNAALSNTTAGIVFGLNCRILEAHPIKPSGNDIEKYTLRSTNVGAFGPERNNTISQKIGLIKSLDDTISFISQNNTFKLKNGEEITYQPFATSEELNAHTSAKAAEQSQLKEIEAAESELPFADRDDEAEIDALFEKYGIQR